jgi:predicted permease
MRARLYRLLSRIRDFLRPAASEAEFDEELESHLAMAEEEKIRRGLTPQQARREARLELGGVTQLREAGRAARGLPWLETSWLDAKLGIRMLRRSWGLTVVGGLAMTVTIGLGASLFTIWDTFVATELPLAEGDRIVAIQPFDRVDQRAFRASRQDLRHWRETFRTIEQISAMRTTEPAVVMRDVAAGSVAGAEMTASAFQLTRVQPMIGRPLMEEDEREGAEPVAVIDYELWQSGFTRDPAVLGAHIQIADTQHIIVGVMPRGFRFPVNQRLWTPLRTSAGSAFVFGRLAPGATLEGAQAEAATVGLLTGGGAARGTRAPEVRVVPYAVGIFPDVHSNTWLPGVIFVLGALLLIPPCANIAILVYARALTRREEFAARTVLGASRVRIVSQVFIELLVLAVVAGLAGFVVARQFSGPLSDLFIFMGPGGLPFWMDFSPSWATVLCVAGLTLIAAALAGAVPAFRVTGRWQRSGVFGSSARGRGARLGRTWTTLLATQLALSVAILPPSMELLWGAFRQAIVARILGPGMPVHEFLTAFLVMPGDRSRFDTITIEAVRQLRSEPGVSGVTMSTAKLLEEPSDAIEVEGRDELDVEAQFNSVDDQFFAVFGARFLAGRNFEPADFEPGRIPVIVNRSFATEILGDTNALGRRVRYRRAQGGALEGAVARPTAEREGRWHEIVGVVEDFPISNDDPTIFHPMTDVPHPVSLTARAVAGTPPVADQLRAVAGRLDQRLRVGRLRSLDEMYWQRRSFSDTFGVMVGIATLVVLLFSMAGMYTLTAFIVAQRWHEIGLRAALGASPRRLLFGIFGRAATPLVIGAVAGCSIAVALQSSLSVDEIGGRSIPGVVAIAAALMIVIGLLAVAGPARRAIRIDPTEALRLN